MSAPGARILVVDDLVDAAECLAVYLRMLGHTVRTAYDGPTAIAAASQFAPHVILLDIGLPGMNAMVLRSLVPLPRVPVTLIQDAPVFEV